MPFKKNAKRSAAASNREAAKKGRGDRPAEAAAPDGENAANAKVGCGGSVSSADDADDERANTGDRRPATGDRRPPQLDATVETRVAAVAASDAAAPAHDAAEV